MADHHHLSVQWEGARVRLVQDVSEPATQNPGQTWRSPKIQRLGVINNVDMGKVAHNWTSHFLKGTRKTRPRKV